MFYPKYNQHIDKVFRKRGKESSPGKRRLHMSERTENFPDWFFDSFVSSLTQSDFIEYRWPDELKERIAQKHNVSIDNVFVGPGSEFILSCIFSVFVSEDSEVWMPEAHFPMYDVFLAQNRGTKKEFFYDETLQLIFNDSAKCGNLTILGNPNSPVGDCVPLSFIEKLKGSTPVVLDQAYGEFGKTDVPVEWITEGIIFVNTFSKAYGAAGCRIGYAIADTNIVSLLEKFKLGFDLANPSAKFAIHLLDHQQVVDEYVTSIILERDKISKLNTDLVLVKKGNWVHLNQEVFTPLIDPYWEIRKDIILPKVKNPYLRITIFSGIYDLINQNCLH